MKVTIINKCIKVGSMEIAGIGSSTVVLIGDTETIVNSSIFDTPADSLIFDPRVPLKHNENNP
ncbi:spore gernimation protein GerPD [Paenibacillus spongiae]|uniref:Spore gernimation protein GerPD n=1 Tax=Paenibacillus spongiae TaxID=2909671 RepID=A0ABY5SH30_9BACL|nr:spore gernimation protein GerPD [Paenibacillus spongiae]UVI33287.1 spore gernimation protein GerPD [Paenibacillus spongiae]